MQIFTVKTKNTVYIVTVHKHGVYAEQQQRRTKMKAKTNAKAVKEVKAEEVVMKQPTLSELITATLRMMRKSIYKGLRSGIGDEIMDILVNADAEIGKALGRKALENRIKEFTPDELEFLKKMLAPKTEEEEA